MGFWDDQGYGVLLGGGTAIAGGVVAAAAGHLSEWQRSRRSRAERDAEREASQLASILDILARLGTMLVLLQSDLDFGLRRHAGSRPMDRVDAPPAIMAQMSAIAEQLFVLRSHGTMLMSDVLRNSISDLWQEFVDAKVVAGPEEGFLSTDDADELWSEAERLREMLYQAMRQVGQAYRAERAH